MDAFIYTFNEVTDRYHLPHCYLLAPPLRITLNCAHFFNIHCAWKFDTPLPDVCVFSLASLHVHCNWKVIKIGFVFLFSCFLLFC
jgi:hypothetical protein